MTTTLSRCHLTHILSWEKYQIPNMETEGVCGYAMGSKENPGVLQIRHEPAQFNIW